MKYVLTFRFKFNDVKFTLDVFATDTHTIDQSLADCIKTFIYKADLIDMVTVPLDGDEEPMDEDY